MTDKPKLILYFNWYNRLTASTHGKTTWSWEPQDRSDIRFELKDFQDADELREVYCEDCNPTHGCMVRGMDYCECDSCFIDELKELLETHDAKKEG